MTPSPTNPTPKNRRDKPRREKRSSAIVPDALHPGLIPGIGVEHTQRSFRVSIPVFGVTSLSVIAVAVWAIVAPENMTAVGAAGLDWVTSNFSWLFSALTILVFGFMLIVGYGRTGGIRLGEDDEEPELSLGSWISMLFAAGIGIGLIFYGPVEPLTYFLDPPHGFDVDPGTVDAMNAALAQTVLHWGPMAWSYYALVGGAIAYASFRRGRPPLISALFDSVFSQRTKGWFGPIIDIFAVLVTLFGTAVSLGIGSLQIATGTQIVTGLGEFGNGVIIGIIAVLTSLFILSAVSGVKRGIRLLSNVNMIAVALIALFVMIVGPTLFLLNLVPTSAVAFVSDLGTMLMRNTSMGESTEEFMQAWTTYYWAWWVSWTPFVGLFVAKISRGRTLRQFVTVVIIAPSFICLLWFGIIGGTSMWFESRGVALSESGSPESAFFALLDQLPFTTITSVVILIAIVIFFVTSADSASVVMGSLSQGGKPVPSNWVIIFWGLMLGLIAATLLVAGGQDTLTGLQAIMVVTALPFAFVIIGIMWAWAKDLRTDPYMIRDRFAKEAIAEGVRAGIAEHGDDFVFGASEAKDDDHSAGGWLDTSDPSLSEWYNEASTGTIDTVSEAEIQADLDAESSGTGRHAARAAAEPDDADSEVANTAGPDASDDAREHGSESR